MGLSTFPTMGRQSMEFSPGGNIDSGRDQRFLFLLGRHELQLAACVHALVPGWHDAEDILQETKLQLWREFDTFEPGSDFIAWARTVARYVAMTHFKRCERSPRLLDVDVAEAIMAKVVKPVAESDRRLEILAGCVRKLGGDALDLLRRCYVDQQKIKDIAAGLNRSLTGTYSAISRIRRELLECVREGLRREDGP